MKKTLIMRGGIILSIACGCFLFCLNAVADGGFTGRDDLLVTPPALLEVVDNFTNYKQPYIRGSVLNEVKKVKILIDGVLTDEFDVNQNDFSYQSIWNLKLGPHFVYAIGFNALGQASRISNVINFNVKPIDPHAPQISAIKIEAEEATSAVENIQNADKNQKVNNIKEHLNITKEFLLFLFIILASCGWLWYNGK
ncbi:MAG: hypothetical protein WC323_01090 [Patescibacteria group bacterium]